MRRLGVAAVLVAGVGSLHAQTTADGLAQRAAAGWMMAWSPYASLADLPRILPAPIAPPDLLGAPAPRVGLWWTAGIPGAMPFEVSDRRSIFRGTGGGTSGPYRRALDPDDVTVVQMSALTWSPIATSGGAAAAVLVDQERAGARPFAATLLPYASDPFVVTDTTVPEHRRVRARVEGAFAWRVGPVGAGVAAGVEESDERTVNAPFAHIGRSSTPAVRLGLAWAPLPALRLAAYGRWIAGSETITLFPRAAGGLVFLLSGYHDPDSTGVTLAPFFRRSQRSARSGGLAAAGSLLGAEWVLFAERSLRHNRHFSVRLSNPPTDRWDAKGWTIGAAAQRRLGETILVTAQGRWESLQGDGQLADLAGVILRARESALMLSGEVRYAPAGSAWAATATGALSRIHRDRYDFIVEVGSDLVEWTPSAALAVARRIGRTSVAVGASGAAYSAAGSIPDASLMGSVYQRLVAPDMTVAATRARPLVFTLGLGHRLGTGTTLLLDGYYETLARSGPYPPLGFLPEGDRRIWSVTARVVLGPGAAPR